MGVSDFQLSVPGSYNASTVRQQSVNQARHVEAICQAESGTYYMSRLPCPEAVQFLQPSTLEKQSMADTSKFPSLYPRPASNSGACSVANAR